MADDLEFQFNNGNFIFQEVVIISKEIKFDDNGFAEVRNERTLKVLAGYPCITRINNLIRKNKDKSVRLKFKTEHNIQREMTFDCNADIKYVKKEKFECDNQNRSHTEITNEIIQKMRDFL